MIQVSRPDIGEYELSLVSEAISSGWISSLGKFVEQFEERFARFCGTRHCILVSNGTTGLHLALVALGVGVDDEVIVPNLTFVATANAVKTSGAIPVFVDVCRDSWCIDPEDVERNITRKTRAIIPVHLYGHPANMDALRAIAKRHSLFLIEDAAEAHGADYNNKKVGSLGDVGVFSFYGNKIITTGEGGAITTDSDSLATHIRFLRDHAMSKETRYWHTEVGFNYRITNIQAAVGVAQLSRIDSFIAARDEILLTYRKYLSGEGLEFNPHVGNVRPVNWMSCVLIDEINRRQRDSLIDLLRRDEVDTRPFFFPVSAFPMYAAKSGGVAEDLSSRGLNLPTYVGLSESQIATISKSVLNALKITRKLK